jgi:hypothetical protein
MIAVTMTAMVLARPRRYCIFVSLSAVVLLIALQGPAGAQSIAPPRTIADITAILDQEKPDLERLAVTRASADAPPPQNVNVRDLVEFYFNRAFARSDLGRYRDSIAPLWEMFVRMPIAELRALLRADFPPHRDGCLTQQ